MDIKKHKAEILSRVESHEGLNTHFTNLFKELEGSENMYNAINSPKVTTVMKPRYVNDLKDRLTKTWELSSISVTDMLNEVETKEELKEALKNFNAEYLERFKTYQEATTAKATNGNVLYSDRKPPKVERKVNDNAVKHSEKLKS